MNLKEAFRFQNKLNALTDEAQEILNNENNVVKTENTYLRHKVMAEAEDETVVTVPETEYHDAITEVVRFLMYLLDEKSKLFAAIRKAKNALAIDLDSEVSLNVTRQTIARTLRRLNELRNSEQILPNGGTGYRFNAEGNQTSYRCDIKRVVTINYDRNVVRSCMNELNRLSDATSTQLDLCYVTAEVDYEPPFDVNNSFKDAFEQFVGDTGA